MNMNRFFLINLIILTVMTSCNSDLKNNPLLQGPGTPYGAPAFDKIEAAHYLPAFKEAIKQARKEVNAIAGSKEAPTFANTIEALEFSGETLTRISSIFFNLNEAETNDQMQQIALEVSPLLTDYQNDITLNAKLFKRIETVYAQCGTLQLTQEQKMLLEKTYKNFQRNGAALPDADKAKYREITSKLSNLSLKFGQNALASANAFLLEVTDSADLAGLPAFATEAAKEEAESKGKQGWVFTLQAPSYVPFMNYSEKRGLREKMWRAYNTRAMHGGDNDNREIIKETVTLRQELAALLGYPDYASYVLENRMAETPDKVYALLNELTEKSMPHALADYQTIQKYAASKGFDGTVMPWDWAYYSEKYKDETYNLNTEILKPYFKLENVEKGVFLLADTLFGLRFNPRTDLPVYHADVKVFEVTDRQGRFMALLYLDYFPREGKRPGAWMTSFREQQIESGVESRPLVSLVCNFTKPTSTSPSLLTFDEVNTLLHEFGHALHGMLAEGSYPSLTGTSVYRDFVELPSQIMENWGTEKEFLDLWAVHYQTGEKIPQEIVGKIIECRNYMSGYASSRQLTFGLADMAWHTLKPGTDISEVEQFEKAATASTQVLPRIDGTAFSPAFGHIFSGGYAAGYYSYKWAEVLEADAFSLFEEKGIFNREVADSFRENILSKGGTENPMALYVRFRGHEPQVDALIEKLGLN